MTKRLFAQAFVVAISTLLMACGDHNSGIGPSPIPTPTTVTVTYVNLITGVPESGVRVTVTAGGESKTTDGSGRVQLSTLQQLGEFSGEKDGYLIRLSRYGGGNPTLQMYSPAQDGLTKDFLHQIAYSGVDKVRVPDLPLNWTLSPDFDPAGAQVARQAADMYNRAYGMLAVNVVVDGSGVRGGTLVKVFTDTSLPERFEYYVSNDGGTITGGKLNFNLATARGLSAEIEVMSWLLGLGETDQPGYLLSRQKKDPLPTEFSPEERMAIRFHVTVARGTKWEYDDR